jgi:two-component system NtrC family sensor kinase
MNAPRHNSDHSITVLIVDDDRHVAELVGEYVRDAGYCAILRFGGIPALKAIEEHLVDLVVLDVVMPDLEGFTVAKMMKSYFGKDNFVPIIMLTALSGTQDRITGLEHADDIISKPFAPKELLARINALLRTRNLQHELLDSKSQYQFLYDNAPYMYVSIDDEETIIDCNSQFCAINGLAKPELLGRNIRSFFSPESRSVFETFIGALHANLKKLESPVLTMKPLCGGPSEGLFVVLSAVQTGGVGGASNVVIVMQDISLNVKLEREQRNARIQMYRSARLASIGTLASGVAHELNNPLTAILGFSNALIGRIKGSAALDVDELSQYLSIINTETLRCRDIIENLSKFAREREVFIHDFPLKECVDGALKLITSKAARKNITILSKVPPSIVARADHHKLEQVIIYVMTNCLDFCGDGCSVDLSATDDAQTVKLSIADNGPGIAAQVMSNVFDPFFTTKEVGQGAGLGLAISHHIMEECNGAIDVASEPGKGVVVTLEIPKA